MKKFITILISGFVFGGTVLTTDQLPIIDTDTPNIIKITSTKDESEIYEKWDIKYEKALTKPQIVYNFKTVVEGQNSAENMKFISLDNSLSLTNDFIYSVYKPSDSKINIVYRNFDINNFYIIIQPLNGEFNADVDDIRYYTIKDSSDNVASLIFYCQKGSEKQVPLQVTIIYRGD